MFLVAPPSFRNGTSFINDIKNLGLGTNLELCLDAGDANSYPGSGQTWLDLSGHDYDFYRGATGSAEASDPTFNGTAGRQSSGEYFSFDGGDYFRAAQANPAWVESIHKNSAKFTIAQWCYLSGATTTSVRWGDTGTASRSDGSAYAGFQFGHSASSLRRLNLAISVGGSGGWAYLKDSAAACNNTAWNFIAVSMDEAAGALSFQINGTSESYSSQTYSSPDSGSAESTLEIGGTGAGVAPDASGGRIGAYAGWSRALSAAELASLFEATRGKFGI